MPNHLLVTSTDPVPEVRWATPTVPRGAEQLASELRDVCGRCLALHQPRADSSAAEQALTLLMHPTVWSVSPISYDSSLAHPCQNALECFPGWGEVEDLCSASLCVWALPQRPHLRSRDCHRWSIPTPGPLPPVEKAPLSTHSTTESPSSSEGVTSSSDWSLSRSQGNRAELSANSRTGAMLGRRLLEPFSVGRVSVPPPPPLPPWEGRQSVFCRSMATVPGQRG